MAVVRPMREHDGSIMPSSVLFDTWRVSSASLKITFSLTATRQQPAGMSEFPSTFPAMYSESTDLH